jgi:radical SAM-linked protein
LADVKQFFRLRFSKQGDVRFISHHDLMRLFERALRRAGLPLAMSQGFNPHPLMSLPAPLGVGIGGTSEVLDFELCEWVRPEEVRQRLERELAAGIEIKGIQCLPSRPDRRARQLSYRVALLDGHPVTEARVEALLSAEELIVHRCRDGESKTLDIRPFIEHVRLRDKELHILLKVTERGTARPEEVLESLGCQAGVHYLRSSPERTQVNLSSSL